MILIEREPEPPQLAAARARQLPHLQAMHAAGTPIKSGHITDYGLGEVRAALYRSQHGKCCYCENGIESAHHPIEHHRPKVVYWWLAHAWENLFYVCWPCNGEKRDQFPLGAGSVSLSVGESPPGREIPLLINPAEIDGVLHICFERVRLNGKDEWIPRPRNDSESGRHTIKVCGLDRGSLRTEYQKHVTRYVMGYVNQMKQVLREGDVRVVHRTFGTVIRSLLGPSQRFIGLSYDALRHYIPDADLAPHGLAWRRPP